ncbi:DUF2935 domain-containing protein [Brevibacillus ginsengisoli]|uniref:DUF2935 domain-containing protein n=1 Tax=Brevibacillus ginsengisoli TaxID=363854 RepID=UPI003CF12898
MQFYYGDMMPLRILDEGEFWKHQESEHTDVIQALVPNLEPQFVDALKKWGQAFAQTQALFVRYIETVVRSGNQVSPEVVGQILQLVKFSMAQSEQFIAFLNQLAEQSVPLKSNPTAITVLNHIRRESEYFIGITQALLSQPQAAFHMGAE